MDEARKKLKESLAAEKLRFAKAWRARFNKLGNQRAAFESLGLSDSAPAQWGITKGKPNIPGVFEHAVMCKAMGIPAELLAFDNSVAAVVNDNPSLKDIIGKLASAAPAKDADVPPASPERQSQPHVTMQLTVAESELLESYLLSMFESGLTETPLLKTVRKLS